MYVSPEHIHLRKQVRVDITEKCSFSKRCLLICFNFHTLSFYLVLFPSFSFCRKINCNLSGIIWKHIMMQIPCLLYVEPVKTSVSYCTSSNYCVAIFQSVKRLAGHCPIMRSFLRVLQEMCNG